MRKKSVRKAADAFISAQKEIDSFLNDMAAAQMLESQISWAHEYAIIRLYREFENLIFSTLIAAINRDTNEISNQTGIRFPEHMTDEVCEYLIVGTGYFDFRGRDGLIKIIGKFVSKDHYLLTIVKDRKYLKALDQLSALRNFAAHDSKPSKKRALQATEMERMASAGAWLKVQGRYDKIARSLAALAQEIKISGPD